MTRISMIGCGPAKDGDSAMTIGLEARRSGSPVALGVVVPGIPDARDRPHRHPCSGLSC